MSVELVLDAALVYLAVNMLLTWIGFQWIANNPERVVEQVEKQERRGEGFPGVVDAVLTPLRDVAFAPTLSVARLTDEFTAWVVEKETGEGDAE